MKGLVLAYRAMAYITGVLIIVLVFAGIPLQFAFGHPWIDQYVGTVHGWLYVVYVIVAFMLSQKLRMRTLSPGVLILLLAGIIPVATFVVERWMMRSRIAPALAGEAPGKSAPQQPVSR
jgi:integral membrane protein